MDQCTTSPGSKFADCDNSDANGCETNLLTDPSHCGTCTNACGSGANCSNGTCICPGVTNTSGNPVVQKCYTCLGEYCCDAYAACLNDPTCAGYLKTTWAGCVNSHGLSGCCFGCGNNTPLWTAMRTCVANAFNNTPSCGYGCGSTS